MNGYRLAILAMAACDIPAASPTARRDAPAATAARMRRSRRSVHSRAFWAALATAERSGTDGTAEVAVLLPDGAECDAGALGAGLPLGLAGGAEAAEVGGVVLGVAHGASGHGCTVNQVHALCQPSAQPVSPDGVTIYEGDR